jgi:hypothetical protein
MDEEGEDEEQMAKKKPQITPGRQLLCLIDNALEPRANPFWY